MLPKCENQLIAQTLVNRGNALRATALTKQSHTAWLRGIREVNAPSLFDFQFEEIDGEETDETVRQGFLKVKGLISQAFTRRQLTTLCVSGCHMFEPNAVTINEIGFVRNGIGYDKLNLCFLFYQDAMAMAADLHARQIHPRVI